MKSPFGEKLISCPVCKKKYLETGLSNHIINFGKGEVWRNFNIWLDLVKNKSSISSPAVWLRVMPHLAYWRKNQKLTKRFIIKGRNDKIN